MTMRHIMNEMRRQANAVLCDVAMPSSGIVRSYDPKKYAVRVELQPEGNLTGWIPLKAAWVGNGWGMYCPPSIGDLVEVSFPNGDIDSGTAGMRFYNDEDVPLAVESGEFWLVHKAGQVLKFKNDGTIEISAPGRISYSAEGHHFHGPITTDSTITAAGDVIGAGVSLENHLTAGVKSGLDQSGKPIPE